MENWCVFILHKESGCLELAENGQGKMVVICDFFLQLDEVEVEKAFCEVLA
ncbi:hypothetical protein [Bartonella sp. CB60]|uniref:hypothetical protein n=1 Tax=Bartonella sp. CB60 TaxID=3113619 RepID=UPI00300DD63F